MVICKKRPVRRLQGLCLPPRYICCAGARNRAWLCPLLDAPRCGCSRRGRSETCHQAWTGNERQTSLAPPRKSQYWADAYKGLLLKDKRSPPFLLHSLRPCSAIRFATSPQSTQLHFNLYRWTKFVTYTASSMFAMGYALSALLAPLPVADSRVPKPLHEASRSRTGVSRALGTRTAWLRHGRRKWRMEG